MVASTSCVEVPPSTKFHTSRAVFVTDPIAASVTRAVIVTVPLPPAAMFSSFHVTTLSCTSVLTESPAAWLTYASPDGRASVMVRLAVVSL